MKRSPRPLPPSASERGARSGCRGPVRPVTLIDLYAQIQAGKVKELALIIKADGQGSIEPIVNSLEKLGGENVKVNILHAGTGNISENDVMLAVASHGIVIGFNVIVDSAARKMADASGVDVRLYNIIYKLVEDVDKALKGMLEPVYADKVIGHAEVRQTFQDQGRRVYRRLHRARWHGAARCQSACAARRRGHF